MTNRAPVRQPEARPALRADAARNRAQLLDAARRELATGTTALPMNLIARSAGVGVGTVYRHFPTQQSLLEGLAHGSLETLVAETEAAGELADPAEGLERMLRSAVRCQLADPALAAVLSGPSFECIETFELGARLADAGSKLLRRAVRARAIRRSIGADDLRRLASGLYHALQAGNDPAEHLERYLRVIVDGLRPWPERHEPFDKSAGRALFAHLR